MTQSIITSGDASAGMVIAPGSDGTLVLQSGPSGAKVNSVSFATDGTPTLIKGPTIGTAPTPTPSSSAPLYNCRGWCVFNGTLTGTNAPLAGGNVTSITRNSTGNYTVNLTTAMSTNTFAVFANAAGQNRETAAQSISTTAITLLNATTAGSLSDEPIINVAIFG